MPKGIPEPVDARLWANVDKTETCWVWTGACTKTHAGGRGYGRISGNGRCYATHRLSWELHNGPIPEGMDVLHTCDNPPCVNPSHLFLGTDSENQRDMIRKGRRNPKSRPRFGEKHHNTKLTNQQAKDIMRAVELGQVQRLIALQYGINQSQVSRIANRRRWSSVTEDVNGSIS